MSKNEIYDKVKKSLNYLYPTDDSLIESFIQITHKTTIKKGQQFVRAGDKPEYVGFNLNGIMRLYYIDDHGNDFTKGFVTEGKFIISYSAQVEKRPSYFTIEAIEDTEILKFKYNDWLKLIDSDSRWYPILYNLVQTTYIMKEKREKSFLLDDAKTRYLEFEKSFPNLINRIKLSYVASFLGMKPETLSRIRKKVGSQ